MTLLPHGRRTSCSELPSVPQGNRPRAPEEEREQERRALQDGRRNKAVPDEADLERKSQKQDGKDSIQVSKPDEWRAPSDRPDGKVSIQAVPAWGLAATLGQSENLRKRGNPRRDGQNLRENRKKRPSKKTPESKPCTAYVLRTLCVRSPYAPRTSRVCPEYDPLCCRNRIPVKKGEPQKW